MQITPIRRFPLFAHESYLHCSGNGLGNFVDRITLCLAKEAAIGAGAEQQPPYAPVALGFERHPIGEEKIGRIAVNSISDWWNPVTAPLLNFPWQNVSRINQDVISNECRSASSHSFDQAVESGAGDLLQTRSFSKVANQ